MTTLVIGRTWDGQAVPEAERASVRLGWDGDALRIEVDAPFTGSPPGPPGPPGPVDKLWEHEVVELMVVGRAPGAGTGAGPVPYAEIELSPHGHHLALRLEGIRNIVASKLPIEFHATIAGDRWTGVARVPRSVFPDPPLTCNAYRIAGAAPARRYFAMVGVPGERPDFHRLDRFVPWPL